MEVMKGNLKDSDSVFYVIKTFVIIKENKKRTYVYIRYMHKTIRLPDKAQRNNYWTKKIEISIKIG